MCLCSRQSMSKYQSISLSYARSYCMLKFGSTPMGLSVSLSRTSIVRERRATHAGTSSVPFYMQQLHNPVTYAVLPLYAVLMPCTHVVHGRFAQIFQTFNCQKLREVEASYLRADFSLECYTPEHQAYMVYAGFFIFICEFTLFSSLTHF